MRNADLGGVKIERDTDGQLPVVCEPFILITPSYSDAYGVGAVPKLVIQFLNNPDNRQWLRGVVGCGDRNFGALFAYAADVIADKCGVPVLHRIELFGTEHDFKTLQQLNTLFSTKQQPTNRL